MRALFLLVFLPCLLANMNIGGIPYKISNPAKVGTYSTQFTDEYFEVYSQVQTRYSQVYWATSDPVPLPTEIVNRFKGKVMAITGYEADQVIKTPDGDKPFPIYYAYNHHYFSWLLGENAEMVRLPKAESPTALTNWMVKDKVPNVHGYPTSIVFKENPGGEYRKSYHGYPKGFAQLIHSPTSFVVEPMQIDTHNREYNGSGYKQWFLPKSIQNSFDPNSKLSPLIECPCSDRITKTVISQANIINSGTCQSPITTAPECFTSAISIAGSNIPQIIVNDKTLPSGCNLVPFPDGSSFSALFNTVPTGKTCGSSGPDLGVLKGHTGSLVDLTLAIDPSSGLVNISMAGPSDVWYGVGFSAGSMNDLPYAIIVDGNGNVFEYKLANHAPGIQLAPTVKVISNTVSGSTRSVVLTRPITGANPSFYYTFPTTPGIINFINAVGQTPYFAYHKNRTASSITLVSTKVKSCLCSPSLSYYISYMNGSTSQYNVECTPEPRGDMAQQHNPACKLDTYHGGIHCCRHLWFLTDVNQDQLIPSAVDTYYMKFRYYFQEYVPATARNPPSHYLLHHWVFLIDAEINDYEEVQCPDGSSCENYISAHLTAAEMGLEDIPNQFDGIMPLVMTPHCHAPSCIREELYNADTGELLCRASATYGTSVEPYNEENYIAIPPCLWGNEPGLRPPIVLTPSTNLFAIKVFNSTYRHLGQMAQWTGLMVYLNKGVIEDVNQDKSATDATN